MSDLITWGRREPRFQWSSCSPLLSVHLLIIHHSSRDRRGFLWKDGDSWVLYSHINACQECLTVTHTQWRTYHPPYFPHTVPGVYLEMWKCDRSPCLKCNSTLIQSFLHLPRALVMGRHRLGVDLSCRSHAHLRAVWVVQIDRSGSVLFRFHFERRSEVGFFLCLSLV